MIWGGSPLPAAWLSMPTGETAKECRIAHTFPLPKVMSRQWDVDRDVDEGIDESSTRPIFEARLASFAETGGLRRGLVGARGFEPPTT